MCPDGMNRDDNVEDLKKKMLIRFANKKCYLTQA